MVNVYGTVRDNAAEYGGAISLEGGILNIHDGAHFYGNSAEYGGAVSTTGVDANTNMPSSTINIYGGVQEYNTAYAGGAIALMASGWDGDDVFEMTAMELPARTINMYDRTLRNNFAHMWLSNHGESLGLLGSIGGGAVALMAPLAYFNMSGGTITGNQTLEGYDENTGTYHLQPLGHAISAVELVDGEQLITLTGGEITDNGNEDGTGTAIHVSKQLPLMKVIILFVISLSVELDTVSVDSDLLDLIKTYVELGNSGKNISDTVISNSLKAWYE